MSDMAMWITGVQRLGSCVLLMCLPSIALAQCPPRYQVQALYGPWCQFTGYAPTNLRAINNAGIACGAVGACGQLGNMVVWDGQQPPVPIPFPPASSGAAPFSINENNELAGIAEVGTGQNRGFIYRNGQSMLLNTLPTHNWAEAYSISKDGTVVGFSAGGSQHFAVLWGELNPVALELPIGPSSLAHDISGDTSYICGWMGIGPDPYFGSKAFRWHNGTVVDLGLLPGTTASEGRAVNNLGQICGIAYTPVGKFEMIRHGFFWSDGVMQDIGILPGFIQCLALDLNDAGHVVGYCDMWPQSNVDQPFIWQKGVMFNLNDLIPPELGLEFDKPWAINNAGQIAGFARDKDLSQIGVILTPIPPVLGDVDCDWQVNINDLLEVIGAWNTPGTSGADLNGDGIVNLLDLLIVIDNWSL